MAQDPIQYQPAFSCTELALFEGKASLSQGITPAFFVASSQSGLFLLPKQVWPKIALVNFLKTGYIAGPNCLRLCLK